MASQTRCGTRRFTAVLYVFAFSTVLASGWVAGTTRGAASPAQSEIRYTLQLSPGNAWSHLTSLFSYQPRYPGTAGINSSAAYIHSVLEGRGAAVVEQHFMVNGVPCKNIIGKWLVPGNASADIVILASHYDARARATHDPDVGKRNEPVPAANDGGSSTAILLDMARVLNATCQNASLGITRETWLVFFDAEDQGYDGGGQGMDGFDWIMGSTYMAGTLASLAGSASRVKGFILLDMVGGSGFHANQELNSNQQLLSAFFSMGQCLGYGTYFPTTPSAKSITDDHVPFISLGIPCIDIIDLDYPQWHTTSDDLAHVSAAVIGAVGKVAEGFLLTRVAPATTLAITDPATGRTWTAGSCTGSSCWFEFVTFLAHFWWVLVLAGLAVIVLFYYLHQQKVSKKGGHQKLPTA
ncbi:MAG: M28 family peptidase [Candidatus Sigynarchaeota archaeon]